MISPVHHLQNVNEPYTKQQFSNGYIPGIEHEEGAARVKQSPRQGKGVEQPTDHLHIVSATTLQAIASPCGARGLWSPDHIDTPKVT